MEEATGQEMTKIEKEINKLRILKRITDNIGTYYEKNHNEIICHVSNRKLTKYLNSNKNVFNLKGFTELSKLHLQSLYGIGKPIKYVISDYNFSDITLNTVGDTTIEYNNCIFHNINIKNVKNLIFNECDFKCNNDLILVNKKDNSINSITLNRCKIIDSFGGKSKLYGDLLITANKVEIRECSINADYYININSLESNIFSTFLISDYDLSIATKKLNIINTIINSGNDLSIDSETICTENALFEALTITMKNSEFDFNDFSNVNVKNIDGFSYNGVTFKRPFYKYLKDITPESFELLRQRAILISTLNRVYNKCESDIKEKTNVYTRKLVNKSISDTLGE